MRKLNKNSNVRKSFSLIPIFMGVTLTTHPCHSCIGRNQSNCLSLSNLFLLFSKQKRALYFDSKIPFQFINLATENLALKYYHFRIKYLFPNFP